MSEPSVVSDKADWLSNNLPTWLMNVGLSIYPPVPPEPDLVSVVRTILKHLTVEGVEKVHALLYEIAEEEDQEAEALDAINLNRGNYREGTNGDD